MKRGKGQLRGTISTMPDPNGKFGAEGDLGRLVTLPAGVVGPTRRAKGEAGLGHMEAALDHGSRSGVERAEALVPSSGRIINRHEVALGQLLKLEIGWHKTGRESRSPSGDDETRGGCRGEAGEQRLRRGDRHQGRLGEKRVSASWSSGAASGTHRSGTPPGGRKRGVAKTRPSAEKWPSGMSAKK